MPRRLLTAAAAAAAGAVQRRSGDGELSCFGEDEVAYARMTRNVCQLNWHLNSSEALTTEEWMREGCWAVQAYNTDKFMSTAVYQNKADGRCVLAVSGYHGALAGYVRGALSLMTPMMLWDVCGNRMYAPYVRLMRHHTSLANWSRIAGLLGPGTACRGPVLAAAESMGGSAVEILGACANAGRLHELQPKHLPSFSIDAFYTFGAPGSAKYPIRNPARSDGCFPGKRVYNAEDPIAFFGGLTMNLSHPMIDAVEIFRSHSGAPTFRITPCLEPGGTYDRDLQAPGPMMSDLFFAGGTDAIAHSIPMYERELAFFKETGYGKLVSANVVDTDSVEYRKAKMYEYSSAGISERLPKAKAHPWLG